MILLPHLLLSSSGPNADSHLLTSLAWLLCLEDVPATTQHHERASCYLLLVQEEIKVQNWKYSFS